MMRCIANRGEREFEFDRGVITAAPRIELFKEVGRCALVRADAEWEALRSDGQIAAAGRADDYGMRRREVFQMRLEDID